MRVVLDTNILISAFVFPGGTPEFVYRAAIQGRIELVTSPTLLAEFGRVLSEKFGWDRSLVEEAVGQVARIGTIVRPRRRIAMITVDPDDDRVLEAAMAGHAEVIVSGDRHLTRLAGWEGIRILEASMLLDELGMSSDNV
ncbi:MAG TPA: putative toxin-antitoxin system toxin component, PIN family [Actinomycetota bacterium]|nr:putative toxin-antitoxin system toxin component, PIN family [Actinomycetota bacterium]